MMKEEKEIKKTKPRKKITTKEETTKEVNVVKKTVPRKKAVKKEDTIEEVKTVRPRKKVVKKEEATEEVKVVKKPIEFSLTEVLVIILITVLVVSISSGLIVYNNTGKITISNVVTNSELNEFYDNYNKIVNNYVEDVDKEALIDAAIGGMYDYLGDEYSMYLNEEDTNDFNEQLHGEYTGIGIEIATIQEDNKTYVKVNRVFENSPAEEAGIKAGDIITKVDGVTMKDANEVSTTIKDGKKDSYKITYIRDGKESTLTLTRRKVFINSVTGKTFDNIGYIKIETFSSTTESQVRKVLDSFDDNIKSVVIDLRDNTGGYLDTAYNVSNLFLEKDKPIYQIKDKNSKIEVFTADKGVYREFKKIVVLINGYSASASEILTLALKESAGATVVGVKSYGKGTVQETGTLSSGSMIKYTTAYWLSPKGNSINKLGIKPDIEEKDKSKQLDVALKAAK